ncbi:hypothetical protein IWQ62_003389, partial [Dispira parvispora]
MIEVSPIPLTESVGQLIKYPLKSYGLVENMASGYGYKGPNRCFRFWQDFLKCHESSDRHEQCDPYRLDYLECLHPAKEATRMRIVQEEAQRQHKARGKASE